MNYKVIQENDKFNVVELSKDQEVIESFTDQQEARKFCRHLNIGGGFDGYTPSFVVRKVTNIT